jgi:hypothetical protein
MRNIGPGSYYTDSTYELTQNNMGGDYKYTHDNVSRNVT